MSAHVRLDKENVAIVAADEEELMDEMDSRDTKQQKTKTGGKEVVKRVSMKFKTLHSAQFKKYFRPNNMLSVGWTRYLNPNPRPISTFQNQL